MANRWADYLITRIRKDYPTDSHIAFLEVAPDYGDSMGHKTTWSRQQVIESRKLGYTFVTAPPSPYDNDEVVEGDKVHIITINGVDYLRTDGNRYQSDNLGNLPEF